MIRTFISGNHQQTGTSGFKLKYPFILADIKLQSFLLSILSFHVILCHGKAMIV